MPEAAFFYYIVCLSTGVVSLIVLAVITVRTRHPFLGRFLLFQAFYTLLVSSFTISVHLENIGAFAAADPFLRLLVFIAKCGLAYSLAGLVNTMFLVPGGRWVRTGTLAVLACALVLRLVFSFVLAEGEPGPDHPAAPVSRIIVDTVVVCVLGYLLLARVLRINAVEPAECRALARAVSLLLACFVPFLVVEVLFHRRWGAAVFSPALYAAVSVLSVARLTALFLRVSSVSGSAGTGEPDEVDPSRLTAYCASHGLTRREEDVFLLLLQGLSNREIADRLCVSLPTVKTHVYSLFRKTGAGNRHQLFVRAREKEFIPKS